MPARPIDPTVPRPPANGIAWPPVCDELSGGGGSATDTRHRGLGHRTTGIAGDCAPLPRIPAPLRGGGDGDA